MKRLQLDALVVFVQGGELSLLGGENEVSAMLFNNVTDRRTGHRRGSLARVLDISCGIFNQPPL